MQLTQKQELRHILAPQLRQSLKILALPLLDLRQLVDSEMLENPALEEQTAQDILTPTPEALEKLLDPLSSSDHPGGSPSLPDDNKDSTSIAVKKPSLQELLLRQLGMFCQDDEQLKAGQELIGNVDDNGYLRITLEEAARAAGCPLIKAEEALGLIQQFEPAGIAARSIEECLLLQLKASGEDDPLTVAIVESHLQDVARKEYSKIAGGLKQTVENVEDSVRKISRLNPKPGRNFSSEEAFAVVPDIFIEEDEGVIVIRINDEHFPRLLVNPYYKTMLRKENLDPKAKEFIETKLRRAYELIRAMAKRQSTLRLVVETIVDIQKEAILEGPRFLKPLTFRELAEKLHVHESTVCRVVMNKYCQTPFGVQALKDFFPSRLRQKDLEGNTVSSERIKGLIQELIGQENGRHPYSDNRISLLLKNGHNLEVARRTVAKYREELKILPASYRRIR